MRHAVAIAALLLLAGCSGGDESGLAPGTITARFVPGGLADVIVVTTIDRLPLRAAALVMPDGERIPAYSIDVDPHPATERVPGEATLLSTPGMPRQSAWINTMASTALIRLPDPVQYAKNGAARASSSGSAIPAAASARRRWRRHPRRRFEGVLAAYTFVKVAAPV